MKHCKEILMASPILQTYKSLYLSLTKGTSVL